MTNGLSDDAGKSEGWQTLQTIYRETGHTAIPASITPTPFALKSTLGAGATGAESTFFRSLDYRPEYPPVVLECLAELYEEYNRAFGRAVNANREFPADYQHSLNPNDGTPINYMVQIDMVALPPEFLQTLAGAPKADIKNFLKYHIFEIENSLAMYELLQEAAKDDPNKASEFSKRFRGVLDSIRQRTGKKVAVLTVTEEKHESVLGAEFGRAPGEEVPDDEVFQRTGFDAYFSPKRFREYIAQTGGTSEYVFVVRSSEDTSILKKPGTSLKAPSLLEDANLREIIKAHAVTLNIDKPKTPPGAPEQINDTKDYLPVMGMAFECDSWQDVCNPDFVKHVSTGKGAQQFTGQIFSDQFAAFLRNSGCLEADITSGNVRLRFKPKGASYGAYGHVHGFVTEGGFRSRLKSQSKGRGRYVVQVEMPIAKVTATNGDGYIAIDRMFFGTMIGTNGIQRPLFFGGYRNLVPDTTIEAKKGAAHGNKQAVWGPISEARTATP